MLQQAQHDIEIFFLDREKFYTKQSIRACSKLLTEQENFKQRMFAFLILKNILESKYFSFKI
jgi:hypothetical protein